MGRSKAREREFFDAELADLPEAARWREWMWRVEAAIFAAPNPVPREALARLVGKHCKLDDLIADLMPNCADALTTSSSSPAAINCAPSRVSPARSARRARNGLRDAGAPELTPTELLAVTAIAYLQPATRAEISRLAGKEISRDVIGALKRHGLIDGGLRAPEPGAPFAYVTTKKFLEVFGLASCAICPTSSGSKTRGSCTGLRSDIDLDGALGILGEDDPLFADVVELDEAEEG